jgi:hypothetical protein
MHLMEVSCVGEESVRGPIEAAATVAQWRAQYSDGKGQSEPIHCVLWTTKIPCTGSNRTVAFFTLQLTPRIPTILYFLLMG